MQTGKAGIKLDEEENLLQPFVKPIFGFALNRTGNRQEAEDLTQEILLESFKALKSRADIQNPEAYIWTIAKYRWAQWARRRAHSPQIVEINGLSDNLALGCPAAVDRILQEEEVASLRRELSYLSDLHRRIIVMHYYDGMKQTDIAHRLEIPVGTVKWHLHDARKELKKRMDTTHEPSPLSVNPVRLIGTGHAGWPGSKGETHDFLGRALAQNIVYAAYQKPRTVHEIASAVGVPPMLLEEEIRYLAEYAYLTETTPGRFQTNTIIWNFSDQQLERIHEINQRFASSIADLHFEAIMDNRAEIEHSGIYYPGNDFNFLLWTLLPKDQDRQAFHAARKLSVPDATPERKDGGRYIAFAEVDHRNLERQLGFDPQVYVFGGAMIRGRVDSPLYLWMINTHWSEWRDWTKVDYRDVELSQAYLTGALPDDEEHREDYAYLLERGYLLRGHNNEPCTFNAVCLDSSDTEKRVFHAIPDLSDQYEAAVSNLYNELLELYMQGQPEILRPQIAHYVKNHSCGGHIITYVLKHLVEAEKLKMPLPHQRKTLSTWMEAING